MFAVPSHFLSEAADEVVDLLRRHLQSYSSWRRHTGGHPDLPSRERKAPHLLLQTLKAQCGHQCAECVQRLVPLNSPSLRSDGITYGVQAEDRGRKRVSLWVSGTLDDSNRPLTVLAPAYQASLV